MRTLAVVLAGGRGHRFWPKSSVSKPKQFLNLFGDETLLQATVGRLTRLLAPEDIYVVTGSAHESLVREQLPLLPDGNLIAEPVGRDTAAALGYGLVMIGDVDPETVAVVVPSDHYVAGVETWTRVLADSVRMARETRLPVLIGIPPTRPETAYGYIRFAAEIPREDPSATPFYEVREFIEKPDLAAATRLLAQNQCLWNSGMFVWRVDVALALLRRHLPETFAILEVVRRLKEGGEGATPPGYPEWGERVAPLLAKARPISIDYGILEKTDRVLVALGQFRWDDVGGWEAIARFHPSDDRDNVVRGDAVVRDAERCIVDWDGGPALVVGTSDMVIAGGPGGLLVCPRPRLGEIKGLLDDRGPRVPGQPMISRGGQPT